MIDKLLFVALLSAAIAANHPGHFLPEDPSTENTLISMMVNLYTKMSRMSQTIGKAAEEHVKTSREGELLMQRSCNETRAGLRKAARETIAKGIEKNKTLDAFQCISTRRREGLEKVDAIEGHIGKDMKNILGKVVEKLKTFQLSMEHFIEYVRNFFEAKIDELKNPGSNAKKILNESTKKVTSLERKLKDIEKMLKASKGSLKTEINHYRFYMSLMLWIAQKNEADHIRKCVP